VDAAASLGRAKEVDVILAIGGGSVIDSAKVIAITIPGEHSAWNYYTGKAKAQSAVPLISVLTLAATGSEMNMFAVIQNNKTKQKIGWGCPLMYPRHSFLDPTYTLSVPKNYTAYGITDLIAHSLEAYFGLGESTLPDRFVFSIITEAMEYAPRLMKDPHNYESREKIMYAATMALNGLTMHGRAYGDWGVHSIGHVLSVLFDVPHGASLSIAYPAWMKLMAKRCPDRISHLGNNLFGTTTVEDCISNMEDFFQSIECPVTLSELNIGNGQHELIIKTMISNKVDGANLKMEEADYHRLLGFMS
jgi:alcohol dehydrogenase YqhD (iron-dependent ADH family)